MDGGPGGLGPGPPDFGGRKGGLLHVAPEGPTGPAFEGAFEEDAVALWSSQPIPAEPRGFLAEEAVAVGSLLCAVGPLSSIQLFHKKMSVSCKSSSVGKGSQFVLEPLFENWHVHFRRRRLALSACNTSSDTLVPMHVHFWSHCAVLIIPFEPNFLGSQSDAWA